MTQAGSMLRCMHAAHTVVSGGWWSWGWVVVVVVVVVVLRRDPKKVPVNFQVSSNNEMHTVNVKQQHSAGNPPQLGNNGWLSCKNLTNSAGRGKTSVMYGEKVIQKKLERGVGKWSQAWSPVKIICILHGISHSHRSPLHPDPRWRRTVLRSHQFMPVK